ncbi:MAG: tail fiber protein [Devosia sp.]|nr:tail fiber protein [Devosia sp.]
MDRVIIYPTQIPLETDILRSERYTMNGLGWLAQATLGTGIAVDGLACTPTSPATLTVNVGVGAIYERETLDASAYSSLAADTTHSTIKQGLLFDAAPFTFVAPTTPGQAQNFLIQAGYSDSDTDSTVLPYYNASNPAVAYSGPNGLGTAQNTSRKGVCVVSSKAGAAATSGSQTTPVPDAGFVGLYVITVAYGQSQITTGNISQLSTAPFIPVKLPGVPTGALNNAWSYGADTGSVNVMAVTLSPVPTGYTAGMEVQVKAGFTNTGPATLNVNGLGAVAIIHKDGSALAGGDIVAGQIVFVAYDGTNFQMQASAGTNQFTIPFANDTGAVNAIVANFSPAITAYTSGLLLEVKVLATNTGTTTVNVNGLGAKTIKTSAGGNLTASTIAAGQVIFIVYDGTNFQLGLTLSGLGNVIPYIADSGTTNALAATFSPAIGSLSVGLAVNVKVGNTNTGASTLNVNGLGTTTILNGDGSALVAGQLVAGMIATFAYDGTSFQLINRPPLMKGDSGSGGAAGLVPAPAAGDAAAGKMLTAGATYQQPIPAGALMDFAAATAPSGWLLCYGQAISRTTYAALFAVIGTTFGAGDGSTTFNVPDFRGRIAAGLDNMGGAAASRLTAGGSGITGTTLGAVGGAETNTLSIAQMPQHSHGVTDPGHSHSYTKVSGTNGDANGANWQSYTSTTTDSTGASTTGISIQNAGSGAAHNNTQPTLVVTKIIKT